MAGAVRDGQAGGSAHGSIWFVLSVPTTAATIVINCCKVDGDMRVCQAACLPVCQTSVCLSVCLGLALSLSLSLSLMLHRPTFHPPAPCTLASAPHALRPLLCAIDCASSLFPPPLLPSRVSLLFPSSLSPSPLACEQAGAFAAPTWHALRVCRGGGAPGCVPRWRCGVFLHGVGCRVVRINCACECACACACACTCVRACACGVFLCLTLFLPP